MAQPTSSRMALHPGNLHGTGLGGASLSRASFVFSRGGSAEAILRGSHDRWVRAERANRSLLVSTGSQPNSQPLELTTEVAISTLALSPGGTSLAVAAMGSSRVDLYSWTSATPVRSATLDVGGAAAPLRALSVCDGGSAVLATVQRDGWMEVIAWDSESGRAAVLTQGNSVFSALSDDGRSVGFGTPRRPS